MSEENISLYELLNLSIGSPQRGAVNFSALHALLHAVLGQLDVREMKTRWRSAPPGEGHPDAVAGVAAPAEEHRHTEEERQVQRDISAVEQEAQPGSELQERTASSSPETPSSGPAAGGQWGLRTGGDGVSEQVGDSFNPVVLT